MAEEEPKEVESGLMLLLPKERLSWLKIRWNMQAPGQSGLYLETEDLLLLEEDKQNLLSRYQLPPLVRMDEKDAAEKMSNLQVLQRIERWSRCSPFTHRSITGRKFIMIRSRQSKTRFLLRSM